MKTNNSNHDQNRSKPSKPSHLQQTSLRLHRIGVSVLSALCPVLRSFPIEIRGDENLPEGAAVYACNHSNTHDFFVMTEVFSRLGRPVTTLAAWDGLNLLSRIAFTLGNAVFVTRPDKNSRRAGFRKFCEGIRRGENGVIFPESTWNLHPVRPMLKLNAGFLRASIMEQVPVVPVILEYEEIADLCKKESELYTRCIVTFGTQFFPSAEEELYSQAEEVREIMSRMRTALREELGTRKASLEQIDPNVYLNHLDIKKNRAFGFIYHTEWESGFLLEKENEYTLNSSGALIPAFTEQTIEH